MHRTLRPMAVVLISGWLLITSGCVSVQRQAAFREAGNPKDRKATLLLPWTGVDRISIDGKRVNRWGHPFPPMVAWVIEMLPGKHDVELEWHRKDRVPFSCSFIAEPGRHYEILQDGSRKHLAFGIRYSLRRMSIVVLPPGADHEVSFAERLGGSYPQTPRDLKNGSKIVADFRKVPQSDRAERERN